MEGFNFDVVISSINRVIDNIPDKAATMVADDTVNNFDSSSFGGTNWIPTKSNNPILVKSGNLKRASKNSKESGYKINNGFTLVVDTEYANYHQSGTDRLPKRQFIGVDDKLNDKIMNMIVNDINNSFR